MRTIIVAAALYLLPVISHAADDKVRLGDLIAQGYEINVTMGAAFLQKGNIAYICSFSVEPNRSLVDNNIGDAVCTQIK